MTKRGNAHLTSLLFLNELGCLVHNCVVCEAEIVPEPQNKSVPRHLC